MHQHRPAATQRQRRRLAGLTIFISCLGLLGLVIYITNQRTKEIGIRKVIGASISQIILLLSKDFLRLIGLAILIAIPIAWSSHLPCCRGQPRQVAAQRIASAPYREESPFCQNIGCHV
jgi:hypothetical protein